MKDLTTISTDLFNKVRSRFSNIKLGDAAGNLITDPANARFFDLNYKSEGKSIGHVNIKLDEKSVTVIYNESMTEGLHTSAKDDWYGFLKELRMFAKSNLLTFDTRDITKSNLDIRDYQYLAQENGDTAMSESKLHGTSKTSYQPVGEANIIIKHSKPVNYDLPAGRTLNIESIYIENADGERFKYPFKHLAGARAMARHVANGGNTYDSIGTHIASLSEELYKLRQFKNYTQRNGIVSETLSEVSDRVIERISEVKKEIDNLQKQGYYESFINEFKPVQDIPVPEETVNSWVDALTIKTFNEELKSVFPYIYKLVDHTQMLNYEDVVGEGKVCTDCGDDPCVCEEDDVKEDSYFNQFERDVDNIATLQYEKDVEEGFDPEYFEGEFDYDMDGDDGEMETITIHYTAHIEDGRPVIHPMSIHAVSHESNPSARVNDEWATEFARSDKEVLQAAQEDAEEEWADRDIDNPVDEDDCGCEQPQQRVISQEVVEFVKSMYDAETGTFPRGEEGVKIAVEKQFGETAGKFADFVIEKLGTASKQVQQDNSEEFNRLRALAGVR